MTTTATSWLHSTETWLDNRGKGAWIAAMVLGFVFFWPVGLAILAFLIWSKRMHSTSCGRRGESRLDLRLHSGTTRTSGNAAFDAYRTDTLDRLQREQNEFESFLERLRASKDKAEFDQYLDQRAKAAREVNESDGEPAPKAKGTGAY